MTIQNAEGMQLDGSTCGERDGGTKEADLRHAVLHSDCKCWHRVASVQTGGIVKNLASACDLAPRWKDIAIFSQMVLRGLIKYLQYSIPTNCRDSKICQGAGGTGRVVKV